MSKPEHVDAAARSGFIFPRIPDLSKDANGQKRILRGFGRVFGSMGKLSSKCHGTDIKLT
jgi:hypothetical protein